MDFAVGGCCECNGGWYQVGEGFGGRVDRWMEGVFM